MQPIARSCKDGIIPSGPSVYMSGSSRTMTGDATLGAAIAWCRTHLGCSFVIISSDFCPKLDIFAQYAIKRYRHVFH